MDGSGIEMKVFIGFFRVVYVADIPVSNYSCVDFQQTVCMFIKVK